MVYRNIIKFLVFLTIFLVGVACEQREAHEQREPPGVSVRESGTGSEKSPSLRKDAKLIDVTVLANKTPGEIEKRLGEPKSKEKIRESSGEMRWVYVINGTIEFWMDFKNGKANFFFVNPQKSYAVASEVGFVVGIDLNKVDPVEKKFSQIEYSGNINGIKWHRIKIVASGDKKRYSIITLQVNP